MVDGAATHWPITDAVAPDRREVDIVDALRPAGGRRPGHRLESALAAPGTPRRGGGVPGSASHPEPGRHSEIRAKPAWATRLRSSKAMSNAARVRDLHLTVTPG